MSPLSSQRILTLLASASAQVLTSLFLPSWEWGEVNIAATALNIVGAALAGLTKGLAADGGCGQWLDSFHNGFIAVFTSLAFTMEHAAHLVAVSSLGAGILYLVGSLVGGTAVYIVAFRIGRALSGPVSGAAKRSSVLPVVRASAIPGLAALVVGCYVKARMPKTEWEDAFGWDARGEVSVEGAASDEAHELLWGVSMAIVGAQLGTAFSDLDFGAGAPGRIRWGTWRSNALAFAGVVTAHRTLVGWAPSARARVLRSAPFTAMVSAGLGAVSGFADTAGDAGELVMEGDLRGASANLALNAGTAAFAALVRMRSELLLVGLGGGSDSESRHD